MPYATDQDGGFTVLSQGSETFWDWNVIGLAAMTGYLVAVAGAIAEGVLRRRWRGPLIAGLGTVAGGLLVWLSEGWSDPWTGSFSLRPVLVLLVVLAGVALREVCVRLVRKSAAGEALRPR